MGLQLSTKSLSMISSIKNIYVSTDPRAEDTLYGCYSTWFSCSRRNSTRTTIWKSHQIIDKAVYWVPHLESIELQSPFSSRTVCSTSINAQVVPTWKPHFTTLLYLLVRTSPVRYDIGKEKLIKLKGLKKVAKKGSESGTSVVNLHFQGIDTDNRNRIGIQYIPLCFHLAFVISHSIFPKTPGTHSWEEVGINFYCLQPAALSRIEDGQILKYMRRVKICGSFCVWLERIF